MQPQPRSDVNPDCPISGKSFRYENQIRLKTSSAKSSRSEKTKTLLYQALGEEAQSYIAPFQFDEVPLELNKIPVQLDKVPVELN